MIQNVGIGFVTGRKQFQVVLKSYINNWLEHGLVLNKNIRLHLFVAYDLKYFKTSISDYKNVPPEIAALVDSLNFYGQSEIDAETKMLQEYGIIDAEGAELLFGEGYAKKRNIVLYFACKKKMDKLIFIDDDEYPIATLQNKNNKLLWMGQSVVGTHLAFNDYADITHGHHCGYISPIPEIKFNDLLTENDFKTFIEAISNEIVSWEKIKFLTQQQKGITYADEEILNNNISYEVKQENGMKFISGANLCFNLKSAKKLPPFYNPPGARGEDTFMSTALSNLKVVKVPCYTFHDGFLMYKHILHGVIPTSLESVDNSASQNIKRFINACVGWIRYKPLLFYITSPDNFHEHMQEIRTKLLSVIPKMNAYFETTDFNRLMVEFEKYHKKVPKHFDEFEKTKKLWANLMQAIH